MSDHDSAGQDVARKAGLGYEVLRSELALAIVARLRGNLPAAELRLRGALVDAERIESADLQTNLLLELGVVRGERGDLEGALQYFRRALALPANDERETIIADIAYTYLLLGRIAPAKAVYKSLSESAKRHSLRFVARINLIKIAGIDQDVAAIERYRAELEGWCAERRYQIDFLLALGGAYAAVGDLSKAEPIFAESLALAEETGFGQRLIEAERELDRVSREARSTNSEQPTALDEVVSEAVRALANAR